uniref:Uncharacterized protein n=1 Tax=Panagrolaimus sp. PS1159 TaxID=55785 RepID=A0AC35GWQ2_9BILA
MKIFRLKNIPDNFDVKPLIEFLKTTNLYVTFEFSEFLSEEYRNQLNEIIFEILETDAFIYGPPSLTIPGIELETQIALLRKARKVND